ncbi:ecto-ADP-ribosyltransferase 3 isoform X5 [Camelus ferus]|uniref:NAD(P)(+)--arginine ADP-ribosyltransferase n=2 Tax=Camelus TaxID=9836 RepID=A0A8B8R6R2_CAMFR|nr:ecto-ADP-ribosyltransferase 3 isoform X5 [Camelus dromedarius]XP_032313612.1 ecto-ADP-ribosyltransferase 3 isoform X5 [Camelus ferus]XP_045362135.1 ecto-ADP-ribosyltransferase 3 isoform X6 [Camelus bactrianus]
MYVRSQVSSFGSPNSLSSLFLWLLQHYRCFPKRKMKTGYFAVVTVLLAPMILMDIFQVKAEILDMADNAFDDEYLKCTDRMEIKYVPQLLKEEKTSLQLLEDVWENAKAKWEVRKTQLFLPVSFKDNHGIALMAYISEAQEQTSFYRLFSEAVKMAGQSRKDYIYGFQFKAFHFYLTKALQLLRRSCEDSYKNVVYSINQNTSFTFGGLNQARFGHFTLAYSAKPQAANDQVLLTIHTCFGVAIENFFDKESERIILIPLNEIFHVSQNEAGNNLILQSTNKTCSHYECAFLGGLKTANCVENMEYFQPIYVYNPGMKNQESTDLPGMKGQEATQIPGTKMLQPDEKPEDESQAINNPTPAPAPAPVPGPKTHPSASSGKMLLPIFGTFITLISGSAINLFVAL